MTNNREHEVIEAIAKKLSGFKDWECTPEYIKEGWRNKARDFFALTYPSGHNMIVMLDDDQTFPPFLTHKGMSCEQIVQTTRQSMYDKHWRKILVGKQK